MFLTKKTIKEFSPLKFLDPTSNQIGDLTTNLFFLVFSTADEKKINYSDHLHENLQLIVIKSAYIRAIHYYYSQPTYLRYQVF